MLRGTLDTFSAGELLWLVGRSKATGVLRVHGVTPGVVWCLDGNVTWAAVDEQHDLVSTVARAGLVTAGLDAQATADQIAAEVRNGPNAERIRDVVRAAVEDTMFELASWDDGPIGFDVVVPHPLADTFAFPVTAVLDGVRRRRARWAELAGIIGGADRVVVQAAADGDDDDFTISRTQWRLLGAVDGHRDIFGLSRAVDLGLVATAELVVQLLEAGLLDMVDEGTPRQPGAGALPHHGAPAPIVAAAPVRHLAAVPSGPSFEPAEGQVLTAIEEPPAPQGEPGIVALARELGLPEADYVNAGDKPSRDLIIRLLSAVKEL